MLIEEEPRQTEEQHVEEHYRTEIGRILHSIQTSYPLKPSVPVGCPWCQSLKPGHWIEARSDGQLIHHPIGLCLDPAGEPGLCMVFKPKACMYPYVCICKTPISTGVMSARRSATG